MKRGPKRAPIADKIEKGTYRADRDELVPIPQNQSPPTMPDGLSADAQEIWLDELPRVIKSGVCDLDSSLFADYCSLYALVRHDFRNGHVPKAAYLSELRMMRQLLGIASVSSRAQLAKVKEKSTEEMEILNLINGDSQ